MHGIALIQSLAVSTILTAAIIWTRPWLMSFSRTDDLRARQAAHVMPTLRLGGIGVVGSFWLSWPFWGLADHFYFNMMIAALPLTLIGFLEDIGIYQAPLRRLVAAAISSVALIFLEGVMVERIGVPFLMPLFSFLPFAFVFTVFATVGLVHAFNLIDGLNGLSSSIAIACCVALLLISAQAGVVDLSVPLSILIGAILGFAAFNFPFGRIFLGDGGAYTIGFLLAWLAIFLLSLAPAFSPWAVLLIFFWPIADTLLAIWRRVAGRVSVGQPDRLHVHQVIMRAVEILFLKRRHRAVSNPLTTLIIQPFMLTPVVFGVVFWDSSRHAALALLVFSVFFVFSYFKLIKFIRSSRG